MISYPISVLGIAGATLIPAYLSLYLISNLRLSIPLRYVAAAGFGLTFWFFLDTMNDAAQLDVNQSAASLADFGGLPHVALIVAFLLGIVALGIFDNFAVPSFKKTKATNPQIHQQVDGDAAIETAAALTYSSTGALLFLIPAAVAAVMGVHGLGEGWNFGAAAASAPTTSFVDAFGGILPLASYPLHKFLEAGIVAVLYSCYLARTKVLTVKRASWQIPVLGLLFGGPSVVGAALGFYFSFDTTYFYAFGVTAALYAALRLVEPIGHPKFNPAANPPLYLGEKVFLGIAIGFFLLYGAALLH